MAPSNVRALGREHIPNYPRGFIVLRIFQLFFTLVNIGLASYSVYWVVFVGDCLMLFTSVFTFGVTVWLVSAHSCAPKSYNYWAVLAFDILLFILWLVSFAILAAEAAVVLSVGTYYDNYFDDDTYYDDLDGADLVYGSILAASAGVGAIEFLLFFISLIIHSVVVCRHRGSGLHNKPMSGSADAPIQMNLQTGPGGKPIYAAVPQHGFPYAGQDTAYNPNAMYNGPGTMYNPPLDPQGYPVQQMQQQHFAPQGQLGHYPQQTPSPLATQHTGSAQPTPTPPPQGVYEVPYQQPYQPYPQHGS